ncbi:Hsp70 family protein [Dactylosporangium salmoneum]|uniref:Hsp70 family protein n=1 Tax=Dactylosporangium salmoneum TaxID=53361 RepID=A0ABP5UCQ2_9ACTN
MTQPQQGFAIGVDLGTSNTVAVVRHPDGRTRPLLVDGAPIMPSGVYVDEQGRLHVGRDAYRMAGLDPSRFEPNPKRRIDEPTVLLGDREIATVDLLAAILAAVARAAVEAVGFLPTAVLTYPAAWGARRRDALAEAARRAGWPPVRLVPEPVAAARYFADVLRRPVPVGAALAVFDFGGGTLDIAVVRNDNGRFSVVGSGGVEDLGGLDVDAAIIEHLGNVIAQTSPDAWAQLRNPSNTTQRRDRRLFWDDVRGAKEMLSRTTVAPITVPGRDQALHVTREELERVTEPLIRQAVWETGKVIKAAGLRADQLAGLFLVGGSSRLPLAARLLHADLGIAPTVLEQPELPVAEGALAEIVPVAAGYQTESIPAAPPTAPFSAVPVSPVSGGFGGTPVSAPPGYPMTAGQAIPPGQISSPPVSAAPLPSPVPSRPRRTGLLVGAVAALAVLALVGAGTYWFFFRDRINAVDFKTVASAGELALGADDNAISYPVTATLGSRTYVGWVADKKFHVAAYELDDKKKAWQTDIDSDTTRWQLYPNPDGLVLIGAGGTKGTLRLVNTSNGKQLAQQDFSSDDRVVFLDSVWVVHSYTAKKTTAYAWGGQLKWSLDDDKKGTVIRGPVNAADTRGPADFGGGPTNRDTKSRTTYVSMDGGKINLRDASAGGKVLRSWNDSGDSYSEYAMADDMLIVYGTSSKYTVKVYDLTKQSEPDQLYAGDDKHRVASVSPCGAGRVCVLDSSASDGSDTTLHMLSVADKKQLWQREAKSTDLLVPVGKQILATSANGSSSRLYGEDGTQLLKSEDMGALGVRVTNGSLLFFAKAPSPYAADVALVGVSAASGGRVALGTLPKVVGTSCSWNATKIACVAGAKLQVWAFA